MLHPAVPGQQHSVSNDAMLHEQVLPSLRILPCSLHAYAQGSSTVIMPHAACGMHAVALLVHSVRQQDDADHSICESWQRSIC
jgi:hypothetical protein